MQRTRAFHRATLRGSAPHHPLNGTTFSKTRRTSIVKVYAQTQDVETVTMEYELPSIVVEDLSMDTNDSSTLYSGRASLGRHSVLTLVDTPQRRRKVNVGSVGSPVSVWSDDNTLTATPLKHEKINAQEPFFSTSLEQYPKSPPLGYPQSASVRSLASIIEPLQSLATPSGSDNLGYDAEERVKSLAETSSFILSTHTAVYTTQSTTPQTRELRKRGRNSNLRDLYTRGDSFRPAHQDTSMTVYPACSFEHRLTLAILEAMECAPAQRKSAGERGVGKKSKHLSVKLSQQLGGLRRRLGSPTDGLGW